MTALKPQREPQPLFEERFEFGSNWRRFLAYLTPQRIALAERSLQELLKRERLDGLRFLDVGSGSGLFSLAARRLGATVHSFDYDLESVACTTELRARFFPDDERWTIERGSALDQEYLASLGEFDVVYSWGVLHHTGNMWEALDRVLAPLAPNGILVVALYNDQGLLTRYWRRVKRYYHRGGIARAMVVAIHAPYLVGLRAVLRRLRGRPTLDRGMSLWYDMHDWLGGLPFEVARPRAVREFLQQRGCAAIRTKIVGRRHGCNEFVFMRSRTPTRRILFLARELGFGGAERQLVLLARALADLGWTVSILTFYSGGAMEAHLAGSNVELKSLEKSGRWDLDSLLRDLPSEIQRAAPDVVHSYLDAPNVIAALLRALGVSPPVVWGVRASYMDWEGYDVMRRATFETTRALARIPQLIIANSEAGRRFSVERGYPADRIVVIPNAIDVTWFRPDAASRERVRGEWGIGDNELLVGVVGRLDPMKGHGVFLEAAAATLQERRDVRFVVIGSGEAQYERTLRDLATSLNVANHVLWVSARPDANAFLNALDLLVLPSVFGEGFPNVLGEAMATGVSCVSSDCGDSAMVLGEHGVIVPPGDVKSLARACLAALAVPPDVRAARGLAARESIMERFSIDRLAYETAAAIGRVVVA